MNDIAKAPASFPFDNPKVLMVFATLAAFCTYSCMYAFRKPYTAATFDGQVWLGVNYKVWLVIAQTLGYAASKFYGIKAISELQKKGRMLTIIALILTAWLSLLGFALVPAPYNIVFLFVNGLPLGMVFGVVFSYLEGRKSTEFMGAVLAASFIFSSGFVKSIGKSLLVNHGISEWWMPFIAGSIFVLPMLLSVFLLEKIPAPTAEDIAERSLRPAMNGADRKVFLKRFGGGLAILITTYILLTVLRDIRDNFAADIWKELGYLEVPAIFTSTEIPVAIVVLGLMSLLMLVRDNFKAFAFNHLSIGIGFGTTFLSSILFQMQWLSAPTWFTLTGFGLYLAYVPFNGLLFERLVATFRTIGNVGFIMYLADAFGYLGSVSVLIIKELAHVKISWLHFFMNASLIVGVLGVVLTIASWRYFSFKKRKHL